MDFALVYSDGICFADMNNWKDFDVSLGIAAQGYIISSLYEEIIIQHSTAI